MSDLSKFQKFEISRIERDQIDFAHYNPRRISSGNKKRLDKSLTKFGLAQPPIVNKRTWRIVGGHQRIEILDSKHRNGGYSLDVALVDLSEKEEVELNVILNNASTMGEFDLLQVEELAKSFDIDLGDLGFSEEDLIVDFGADSGLDSDVVNEVESLKKEKAKVRSEKNTLRADGEYTDFGKEDYAFSVTFQTNSEKQTFLGKLGFAGNSRSVNADLFISAMRQKIEAGKI